MREMDQADLRLRAAEASDCDKVFEWRNHPSVRMFSVDPGELDYGRHKAWFEKALENPDRILLVASQGGEDVGVIRYDLSPEKQIAEISIYVKPGRQEQGIGTLMMEAGEIWLKGQRPLIGKIRATVSMSNAVSMALFRKAGFESEFVIFFKDL